MRVLVVEDEVAVADVFTDYLVELGHQPVLARSAEAALGKLESERPDAIILDIHLPGMSGLDFLKLRPVREAGVPIVAVSGVATESQARECLRLGALDFVGKPVPLERLGEVLECLEPQALERRGEAATRRDDRRRAPRARLEVPVRVVEYSGVEWQAVSTSVSAFGVKLRPLEPVRPGKAVRVAFSPPDGGTPLQAMALLIREDADGLIFFFVNLTPKDAERLAGLVKRLAGV